MRERERAFIEMKGKNEKSKTMPAGILLLFPWKTIELLCGHIYKSIHAWDSLRTEDVWVWGIHWCIKFPHTLTI